MKVLPFISIQKNNIFVLPCQLNGASPESGGSRGDQAAHHTDQLSSGSHLSGNEAQAGGVQSWL